MLDVEGQLLIVSFHPLHIGQHCLQTLLNRLINNFQGLSRIVNEFPELI